jgi:hypothetical protein
VIAPIPLIWGVPRPHQVKPIMGATGLFPVRLRFRPRDVAQCFIKMPSGLRHYYIGVRQDGDWQAVLEIARNIRTEAA